MKQYTKPHSDTKCVGCGKRATKYCEGENTCKVSGEFGAFSFTAGCGYPVCETCTHEGPNKHEKKVLS